MNDLKIIYDPESAKLLIDKTRQAILKLLKIRPMSIAELSEILDKDISTIYRHIKKLQEKNLVKVWGERKKKNVSEKVYTRVFSTYILSPEIFLKSEILEKAKKERYSQIRKALTKIGYLISDQSKFDETIILLENRVVAQIERHKNDMDWNIMRTVENILFIKLATDKEIKALKSMLQLKSYSV